MKATTPAPEHYDIDLAAADLALATYTSSVDQYSKHLSELLEIQLGARKELRSHGSRDGKSEIVAKNDAAIQALAKKLQDLSELKTVIYEFVGKLKKVCLQQGSGSSKAEFKAALGNLINHFNKMEAFRLNSKNELTESNTVLWSKIEPRIIVKLVNDEKGEIALESSLAGTLANQKEVVLWGLKKWSSHPDSPVNQFWSGISEEFVNQTRPGATIKAVVFGPGIPHNSILGSVEGPKVVQMIKDEMIESLQVHTSKVVNNENRKIYFVKGALPTDLAKFENHYIFQAEGGTAKLFVCEDKKLQPLELKISEEIKTGLKKHHNIDNLYNFIAKTASQNFIENDSPTLQIKTLLNVDKGMQLLYDEKIPKDLSKYNNKIIIVPGSDSQSFHQVFKIENGQLQPIKLDPAQNMKLQGLLVNTVHTHHEIGDAKPSLLSYLKAIIAENKSHSAYLTLKISSEPLVIKTEQDLKQHLYVYNDEDKKAQNAWYKTQKVRGQLDSVLFSDSFKNLAIFKKIYTDVASTDLEQYLKKYQIDFNSSDKRGWTLLAHAAFKGDVLMVKMLLDNGADINRADKLGFTPLMHAIIRGNLPAVKLLLAHNARTDLKNCHDHNAIEIAKKHQQTEILKLINPEKPSTATSGLVSSATSVLTSVFSIATGSIFSTQDKTKNSSQIETLAGKVDVQKEQLVQRKGFSMGGHE